MGKTGAMVEQLSLSLRVTGNWDYSGFTDGNRADDRRIYPSFALQFRDGWRLTNFTGSKNLAIQKIFSPIILLKHRPVLHITKGRQSWPIMVP